MPKKTGKGSVESSSNVRRHPSSPEAAGSISSEVEPSEVEDETNQNTNKSRSKELKGKCYRKKKSTPRHHKLQSKDTSSSIELDAIYEEISDKTDNKDNLAMQTECNDEGEEKTIANNPTEISLKSSATELHGAHETEKSSCTEISEIKTARRARRGRNSQTSYSNTEERVPERRYGPRKRKIEGIEAMHDAAMETIEDAQVNRIPPTGCISEKLPYYEPSILQHEDVSIPSYYHEGKEVPRGLAILLENFKKDYMDMLSFIQTNGFKQNMLNKLEEELVKKKEGMRKQDQIKCQIQDLQSDCIALLIGQLKKLGIVASTPKEFTEQAKQIVCQHNNLQQIKNSLEEEIGKLTEENEDLMQEKEKELTDDLVQQYLKTSGKVGSEEMKEIKQMVQQRIQSCFDFEVGTHRKLGGDVTLTKVGATETNKKREEPRGNTVEVRKLYPDESFTNSSCPPKVDKKAPYESSVSITKEAPVISQETKLCSELSLEANIAQTTPKLYKKSSNEELHVAVESESHKDVKSNNNGRSYPSERIMAEFSPHGKIDFEDRVKSIITSALAEDIQIEEKIPSPVKSTNPPTEVSSQCTTVSGKRKLDVIPRPSIHNPQPTSKQKAGPYDQRGPRKDTRIIPHEPHEYFHESQGPPIDPRLSRTDYTVQIGPALNESSISSQESKPQDLRIPVQDPMVTPYVDKRPARDSRGMLVDPRMMQQDPCDTKQNPIPYSLPPNPRMPRQSPHISESTISEARTVGEFISSEIERRMSSEHNIGKMSSGELIAVSVDTAIHNSEHTNDSVASRLSKIIEDSVRGQPEQVENRCATYSPVNHPLSRSASHSDMMEGLACPRGIRSPVPESSRVPLPTHKSADQSSRVPKDIHLLPSSLPQVEGLAARFNTYFEKEKLDRQVGSTFDGFAGRFTSPDLQQSSSRPTSVTSHSSLHTPDPLPDSQDHRKKPTSPIKSPALPPKKAHIEDDTRKGREETRQWQDEISAGFDRLLGLATEVDKRRKSSEPNSPSHPELGLSHLDQAIHSLHPKNMENRPGQPNMGPRFTLPYEQPHQIIVTMPANNSTINVTTTNTTVPGENLPEHHFKKRYFNQEYQRQQAEHMKGIHHGLAEPPNTTTNKQKYEPGRSQQDYRQYTHPRGPEVGEMLRLGHEPPNRLPYPPHHSQDRKRPYETSSSSRAPMENSLHHPPPPHHDPYIEARIKEGTLSQESIGRYPSTGIAFRPPANPRHIPPYHQPSSYPRPPHYDPQLMSAMTAYRHQMMYRPPK